MCSQIHRNMSCNRQLFPIETNEEAIISETPDSHPNVDSPPQTTSLEREKTNLQDEDDNHQQKNLPEQTDKKSADSHTLGGTDHDVDEDDEGYKTPTSSDHRIPPITRCPPAPVKPRPTPSKLKRKASPPPQLQPDSSAEIESIFFPISNEGEEQHKIKRARTDDSDRL